MKLKEGDYVCIQELTLQQIDALVAKFIKDGCPTGEAVRYEHTAWKYIGWADGNQESYRACKGIWYFDRENNNYFNGRRKLTYEQAMEEEQVSEFKNMKFWVGYNPELSEMVQKVLFKLGYKWSSGSGEVLYTEASVGLYTTKEGDILRESSKSCFVENLREEINIDWMRKPEKETDKVELNGKTYLKSDLAEALKHIKPLEN